MSMSPASDRSWSESMILFYHGSSSHLRWGRRAGPGHVVHQPGLGPAMLRSRWYAVVVRAMRPRRRHLLFATLLALSALGASVAKSGTLRADLDSDGRMDSASYFRHGTHSDIQLT